MTKMHQKVVVLIQRRSLTSTGRLHASARDVGKLVLFTHEDYTIPLPPRHTFPMHRYRYVAERISREIAQGSAESDDEEHSSPLEPKNLGDLIVVDWDAPLATREEVLTAHAKDYVDRFDKMDFTVKEVKALGLPGTDELIRRTYRIVGGTVEATKIVLSRMCCLGGDGLGEGLGEGQDKKPNSGQKTSKSAHYPVSGNLAGGTHHAFPDRAEGFCVFNDIAVAARVAQNLHAEGNPNRKLEIVVVDLDVHQGNGTAACLNGKPGILTYSLQAGKNYPFGDGRCSGDIDVDLPSDISNSDYLEHVKQGLSEIEKRLQAKGVIVGIESDTDGTSIESNTDLLVFYQAGVDALAQDRLGKLKLDRKTLWDRNMLVYDWCKQWKTGVVLTMGGGYSRPINFSVDCHRDVYVAAARKFCN